MKIQWLLLPFIAVVFVAAGTSTQVSQGDKKKKDTESKKTDYAPAREMTWNEPRHIAENADGVLHVDSGWSERFSYASKLFRRRIDTLCKAPAAALPFTINKRCPISRETLRFDNDATEIQTFVPESGWTRTAIHDPYKFVDRLIIGAHFHTFIFKNELMAFSYDPPVHYYLTTVDTNGYFLASVPIAEFYTPLEIVTAEVSADGLIHSRTLKQVWEKDPKEFGYENNNVKEQVLVAEKTYQVTASGDIILRK